MPRVPERLRPSHVRAAFEKVAQRKVVGVVTGGRPIPAHVQRAVTGALQPKAATQATGMSHQRSPVIQGSFSPHGLQRLSIPHTKGRQQVAQRYGNADAFQLPAELSNFGGAGGQPLPLPVRQRMESVFGTSFADVRVHVGAQAASIGALAFAQGSNLYFAPGQYNPSTVQGLRLLGHELTHVVQQRSGRVRNPFGSGVAVVQDRAMEAEADQMGVRAAAHRDPAQAKLTPSAQGIAAKRTASPHPTSNRFPIQRLRGLTPGTYVEVRTGNGSWYGCITESFEDSYRIRVGGTDSETTVFENQVTLHPVVTAMRNQRVRRKVIADLHNQYFIFSVGDLDPETWSSSVLSGPDALVYSKIDRYLDENNILRADDVTVYDGAKKTLVARHARDVLKIYGPYRGVYDKEKGYYARLESAGVDMRFFVAQWGWDDASLTARADNLASNQPPGDRTTAARQILTHLRDKGLFLNDLNRNDNIGTSLTGAAVVFDVKSLVPYGNRAYDIP